jgi:hypothetical protein
MFAISLLYIYMFAISLLYIYNIAVSLTELAQQWHSKGKPSKATIIKIVANNVSILYIMKDKTLYKPFRSKRKGKKFSVYVKGKSGNPKLIHFGDSNMKDFTQHKDPKRRKSYLARAKGIKNKQGKLTWKDKNTANYWAVHYLWKG